MSKAKAFLSCAAIVAGTISFEAHAENFKYRPWLPEYLEYVACIYDNAGDAYEEYQASCKPVKDRMLNELRSRSTALKNDDFSRTQKYLDSYLKWPDRKPTPGSLDTVFEGFEHLTAGYLRCVSGVITDDADFKVGRKINTKLAANSCKAEFSAVANSIQSTKLRLRARNDVRFWRDWIESSGIEYGQLVDDTLARPDEPANPATYMGEQ